MSSGVGKSYRFGTSLAVIERLQPVFRAPVKLGDTSTTRLPPISVWRNPMVSFSGVMTTVRYRKSSSRAFAALITVANACPIAAGEKRSVRSVSGAALKGVDVLESGPHGLG